MAKYQDNKRCVSWWDPGGTWHQFDWVSTCVCLNCIDVHHRTAGPQRRSSLASRGPVCPNSAGLTMHESSGMSASRLRMPFIGEWSQRALAFTDAKRKSDMGERDQQKGRERLRDKGRDREFWKSLHLNMEDGIIFLRFRLADDISLWWRGQGHGLSCFLIFFFLTMGNIYYYVEGGRRLILHCMRLATAFSFIV